MFKNIFRLILQKAPDADNNKVSLNKKSRVLFTVLEVLSLSIFIIFRLTSGS